MMKFTTTIISHAILLLTSTAVASKTERTANVYIQPINAASTAPAPQLLASIQYDPFLSAPEEGIEILSYEAPEFEDSDFHSPSTSETAGAPQRHLLRVGVYDPSSKSWVSSTSVASVENFAKGYSPRIMLSVDGRNGEVVGAALKGVRIDAGQTRDFGPKAVLVRDEPGSQVELNKPVVLAPNGKKAEPEPEKSMLQKYWWVLAIGLMLAVSGGGDGK